MQPIMTVRSRIRRKLSHTGARLRETTWRLLYTRALPAPHTHSAISFDVFDTLITRTWYTPADQFRAVGLRLREAGQFAGSADDWYRYRMAVETRVRATSISEEVSLAGIYDLARIELGWTQEQATRALAIELAQEMRDIRPIAGAREVMKKSLVAKRTILISDTYFSMEEMTALLRKCGYSIEASSTFLSSSLGLSKRTGRIFPAVARDLGIGPQQLCHVGDHPWSDGRIPAKLGIQSRIIDDYLPTRFERVLADGRPSEALVTSALAGCARAARLSRNFSDDHLQSLWTVSTDIAGPLLFGYLAWVLQRLRQQGYKRVYFLARDGEVMFQMAQRICRWANLDIDYRYLYCSRQSFMLPATTVVDDRALAWMLKWHRVSTIRTVLSRVGIRPQEVARELGAVGFGQHDWDQFLDDARVLRLREVLSLPTVSERILANAQAQRALVMDYLRQEGFGDEPKTAICDVGWQGTIQRCLSDMMATDPESRTSIKGFYFGLDSVKNLKVLPSTAEAYFTGPVDNLVWMIEAFCASTEGSVAGFQRKPLGIEPVLSASKDEIHFRWGAELQRAGILEFASQFTATLVPDDVGIDELLKVVRERSGAALQLFMTRPRRPEAECYGSLQSSAVPTHDALLEGAPKLSISRLVYWLALRDKSGVPWISWAQGSIRRSSRGVLGRLALTGIFWMRNLLDQLRRGIRVALPHNP